MQDNKTGEISCKIAFYLRIYYINPAMLKKIGNIVLVLALVLFIFSPGEYSNCSEDDCHEINCEDCSCTTCLSSLPGIDNNTGGLFIINNLSETMDSTEGDFRFGDVIIELDRPPRLFS